MKEETRDSIWKIVHFLRRIVHLGFIPALIWVGKEKQEREERAAAAAYPMQCNAMSANAMMIIPTRRKRTRTNLHRLFNFIPKTFFIEIDCSTCSITYAH